MTTARSHAVKGSSWKWVATRVIGVVGLIGGWAFVSTAPAQAAPIPSYSWSGGDADNGGSSNWSDGANWVGGLAPSAAAPVNLTFPAAPPSCAAGCASLNDIQGLTVDSLTTSISLGGVWTINLDGPLTLIGNVSVLPLNLQGTAQHWTYTGQDVVFDEVTGVGVTITLAGGSQLTGDFQTAGLAVEGASATAAPASNGTIENTLGNAGAYFADVAINWPANSFEGPFSTSGDDINLTTTISHLGSGLPQTIQFGSAAVFDPASTIVSTGSFVPGMLPFSSNWAWPELYDTNTQYGINLNGVILDLNGCAGEGQSGLLASATDGVTGTFSQIVGGKEVPIANGNVVRGCASGSDPYWRITYTATTVSAISAEIPTVSMGPSSHSPSTPNGSVQFTATVNPIPDGGTVGFNSGTTAIAGCTAIPVNTTTGTATCTTKFAAVGNYSITATYNGDADTPPSAPSPSTTQVVVPPPTATITTNATTFEYLAGQQITGTAADVGGPGVIAVVLYYDNRVTGATGSILATCASCGATQTSVTWDVPVTSSGPVPVGIYSFVAQAVDANDNFGPASNTTTSFVIP
jgi:hypothetical protein